jgi:hypothetical protein
MKKHNSPEEKIQVIVHVQAGPVNSTMPKNGNAYFFRTTNLALKNI